MQPLQVYLNLVLEFVPETVYRISKHYSKAGQRMPGLYVKLYTYQMCRALAYIHTLGVCHRDIKPQVLHYTAESFLLGCHLPDPLSQADLNVPMNQPRHGGLAPDKALVCRCHVVELWGICTNW